MRWLLDNAGLKLVSLMLAALTWIFVKGITSDRRAIEDVPLEIKVGPGRTLLDTSAVAVNVVVRGAREDVWQASRQNVSAVLDLTREDRLGQWEARLGTRMIHHPPRVQVVAIEPSRVRVKVGIAHRPAAEAGAADDQKDADVERKP